MVVAFTKLDMGWDFVTDEPAHLHALVGLYPSGSWYDESVIIGVLSLN